MRLDNMAKNQCIKYLPMTTQQICDTTTNKQGSTQMDLTEDSDVESLYSDGFMQLDLTEDSDISTSSEAKSKGKKGHKIKPISKLLRCSTCRKDQTSDQFISRLNGSRTKQCEGCRAKGRLNDAKRSDRRLKERQQNRDIHRYYSRTYRANKIINQGIDDYHKEQAQKHQDYRMRNPERTLKYTREYNNRIYNVLNTYKYDARKKGKVWELTDLEAMSLILSHCFYCYRPSVKGDLNGIDRVTDSMDYIKDNCVPCCRQCNMMKGCLDAYVFISICEHYICYNNVINYQSGLSLNMHPEMFVDYGNVSYQCYKKKAKDKGIDFHVSKSIFNQIRQNECYLCGKPSSQTHYNGIDRVNNNLGYVKGNIDSCCGTCNFIKRDQSLKDMIFQCKNIFDMCGFAIGRNSYDVFKEHLTSEIGQSACDKWEQHRKTYDGRYHIVKSCRQKESEEQRKIRNAENKANRLKHLMNKTINVSHLAECPENLRDDPGSRDVWETKRMYIIVDNVGSKTVCTTDPKPGTYTITDEVRIPEIYVDSDGKRCYGFYTEVHIK